MISELTESMKHIIQTEIQGILKGYKDQLEKIASPVEMLPQIYRTWSMRMQFCRIRESVSPKIWFLLGWKQAV